MRSAPVNTMLTRGLVTPAAVLVSVLSASLLVVSPARAAAPVRLSGQLDGLVTDVSGKPQPGAIIVLLNQQGRLLQRSATDGLGSFSFGDLMPDLYSIQVSFSSFVPAIRERIQVKAGMRSLLSREPLARVQFGATGGYHAGAGRADERQLEMDSARR